MKKVLFIDRDGTLILEPKDEQIDRFEKLEFLPSVFKYLGKIALEMDFEIAMVTNQDGLGTESFPEHDFWPIQDFVVKAFKNEGVVFDEIFIDKSFESEQKDTRKPGIGMLKKYLKPKYDLANSFVIGDRKTDVQLAQNLGCGSIFIGKEDPDAMFSTQSWKAIYEFLKTVGRKASVTRKTNETDISIALNLDGNGNSDIKTGLKFFDHMLDQLARHGGLDLKIAVNGDLEVDEHHTIEDTALALGEAFKRALGKKIGIMRYGFLLPMDDCLAQVAIDFGGRPWLVWDADFKREKIGDVPTEMFMHFFKSFSDASSCNLNIKAEGTNEHHKVESIFKALAKAIKMAVLPTGSDSLPTTKGAL